MGRLHEDQKQKAFAEVRELLVLDKEKLELQAEGGVQSRVSGEGTEHPVRSDVSWT